MSKNTEPNMAFLGVFVFIYFISMRPFILEVGWIHQPPQCFLHFPALSPETDQLTTSWKLPPGIATPSERNTSRVERTWIRHGRERTLLGLERLIKENKTSRWKQWKAGARGQTDQNRAGRPVDCTVADASVDPSGEKRNTGADVKQQMRGKERRMVEGG